MGIFILVDCAQPTIDIDQTLPPPLTQWSTPFASAVDYAHKRPEVREGYNL